MFSITFCNTEIQLDNSWRKFFRDNAVPLREIEEKISGDNLTPSPENIFAIFRRRIRSYRVIILGQDPYPQENVATGRAFEVGNIASWDDATGNASLTNILKLLHKNSLKKPLVCSINDIRRDIRSGQFNIASPDTIFKKWEGHGVCLLNAALTCKVGDTTNSGAHLEIWKTFTENLVQYLDSENDQLQWLLWGNFAKKLCRTVQRERAMCCAHPRLNRSNEGSFIAENHFKRIDIDWT